MTVYCPAFAIGVPSLTGATSEIQKNQTWVRLFVEFSYVPCQSGSITQCLSFRSTENVVEKTLVYQAIGTLSGSWIGVIPIALDWDRPWQVSIPVYCSIVGASLKYLQAWPLTPAFCAIGGYIVASLVALTVSIQKQAVQSNHAY
jgi:phosphatidylinositol glycan class F